MNRRELVINPRESLQEWMKLDLEDVNKKNFWYDIKTLLKTFKLLVGILFK